MAIVLGGQKKALELERITIEWGLPGALLAALAMKLWLVFSGHVPFNADEAIVALMARHIQGGARPIFFYGQAYMGSLDAFLVAGGFSLLGQQIWVIRLVQGLLYILTIVTTAWLGQLVFRRWEIGVLAAWLLAVPPVNMTLYTTASLGNYGEALLLGNLILIGGLRIANKLREGKIGSWWHWGVWGFLVGLGIWTFGLTLVYSLPIGFALLALSHKAWFRDAFVMRRKLAGHFAAAAAGMVAGASPWLVYAWQFGPGQLLRELGGGGIAGIEGLPWLAGLWQHSLNFFVLGSTAILGFRPPWEVRWLAWPLLPFVLAFWLGVLVYTGNKLLKNQDRRFEVAILAGVGLVLIAGFILTPFGADPSGRYFLPLNILLALFAADLIYDLAVRYGRRALGFLILVVVFNFWGTLQTAQDDPPGLTTQFDSITQIDHNYDPELVKFLLDRGEYYGYSNYWVAYPLAFRSGEKLVYLPRLPYHPDFRFTIRDDRYSPYHGLVEGATRVAYITTHHPALNAFLRQRFQERNIQWQEKVIGDYNIFYELSRKVTPEEMGLGF